MGVRSTMCITRSVAEQAILRTLSSADDRDVAEALECILNLPFNNFRITADGCDNLSFLALVEEKAQ